MLQMSVSNPQIAIAGRVLEGETEKAISGTMVEIIEMPEKFKAILSLKALQYGKQWEKMMKNVKWKAMFPLFGMLKDVQKVLEALPGILPFENRLKNT